MMDNKVLIETCSKLIAEQSWTIAFAESATAGKLAFEFSLSAYAGEVLKGSLVCYNACIKEDILGISKEMIDTYTPESAEVTKEMALRIRQLMKTDIAVGVTGLTTAGGSEEPGKPVGTMFYCVVIKGTVLERKKIFAGTPQEIVDLTLTQIAKSIIHAVEEATLP